MKGLRAVNQLPLTFTCMSLQGAAAAAASVPRQGCCASPASHKDTLPQELGPRGTRGWKSTHSHGQHEPCSCFLLPTPALMPLTFLQGEGHSLGKHLITPVGLSWRGFPTASGMTHPSSEGLEGAPLPALMAEEQEQIRCCNSPSAEFRPAGAPKCHNKPSHGSSH